MPVRSHGTTLILFATYLSFLASVALILVLKQPA